MSPISLTRVRLSTLLFPPVGLVLLWRSSQIGLGRKIFGTFGIALYSLPYAALIIFLLYKFCGLQIELRGGYVPRLTYHKTLPDYAAVEASRAQQKQSAQAAAAKAVAGTNAYWTGFRGPNRDGHYDEQLIQTTWPREGPRLLWRQPIGGGYASFAVAGGRAFTIEQRREQEVITAYDVATGRELWAHGWLAEFQEPLGGDGPRATPAYDESRVYALGALGELRCVSADTGKQLWRRNIVDENQAPDLVYGVSASPLIVDEKVIVMSGGPNGKSVAAYHKVTGEPIWKSLDDEPAYSSPMLVNLAGQRQLLVVSKKRALGIDLAQGKLLWEFPWVVLQGNRNIAQPLILSSNRFLLSASYGTGCVTVEVNKTETGFTTREVWRNKNLKNKFTSSVFLNGYIYGLDEDLLTCLNVETGRREWKEGRYGYGQLLLAGEHLVILSGEGQLALVKAGPSGPTELARFPAINGKTWNHPVLTGGRLLVRNAVEMACFDVSK